MGGGGGAGARAPGGDANGGDSGGSGGGGNSRDRIRRLRSAPDGDGGSLVALAAPALDDGDIEVRGEAFSRLVACRADIAGHVEPLLASPSRNVRAFCALVLANRGDVQCAGAVAALAGDSSAAVRSCAMGSLGHMALRASPSQLPAAGAAARAVRSCLGDGDLEVRRSALHAASCLGMGLAEPERDALAGAGDAEIDRLLRLLPAPAARAGAGRGPR